MKTHFNLMLAASLLAFASCSNNKTAETAESTESDMSTSPTSAEVVPGSYVNLSTGEEVYIVPDPETGYAMDSIAKVPVEFYVNTTTYDTIYRNGMVVNNSLINTEGTWKLDESKIKIDGDEIKIKDGDSKIKIDGDDSKVKSGDYKQKVDDGEEIKTKDGDSKTKVE